MAAWLFYAQSPSAWARAAELGVTLLVLTLLFVQFYALPYLVVRERRSLRLAYSNALLTMLASPLHALLLALALVLVTNLSLRCAAIAFLFAPVLVAMLGTRAVREPLTRFGALARGRVEGDAEGEHS